MFREEEEARDGGGFACVGWMMDNRKPNRWTGATEQHTSDTVCN